MYVVSFPLGRLDPVHPLLCSSSYPKVVSRLILSFMLVFFSFSIIFANVPLVVVSSGSFKTLGSIPPKLAARAQRLASGSGLCFFLSLCLYFYSFLRASNSFLIWSRCFTLLQLLL